MIRVILLAVLSHGSFGVPFFKPLGGSRFCLKDIKDLLNTILVGHSFRRVKALLWKHIPGLSSESFGKRDS